MLGAIIGGLAESKYGIPSNNGDGVLKHIKLEHRDIIDLNKSLTKKTRFP